jgi:hypothetical protein
LGKGGRRSERLREKRRRRREDGDGGEKEKGSKELRRKLGEVKGYKR